jgi:hypothetical protein
MIANYNNRRTTISLSSTAIRYCNPFFSHDDSRLLRQRLAVSIMTDLFLIQIHFLMKKQTATS